MKLTHGLLPGQVLQRDERNSARANVAGTCRTSGALEARVTSAKRSIPWHGIGTAASRIFNGTLSGIPAGGPYAIELRIRDGRKAGESVSVDDVFVGDVWFLGGQSNMQGVGRIADAPVPHAMVRAFYMRDEWGLAEEPLHLLGEAVDRVHNEGVRLTPAQAEVARRNTLAGVCPGLSFAKAMAKRTRVPQGLVLCAHGGTSMAQWSPSLKAQGGASLYGATVRRFHRLGQPVRGVLWYQGESDASDAPAKVYTDRMKELVAAWREDFGQPDLPWLVVQIGRVVSPGWEQAAWNSIREQERLLPDVIPHLDVVPTIDLELDDLIHISGTGQVILGERLAAVAGRLVLGDRRAKGAIRLASIKPYVNQGGRDPVFNGIVVNYRNVVGSLRAAGRPSGFAFVDANGSPECVIYKTSVEGSKVILETSVESAALEGLQLAYGCGFDPYCNISDARGMGLPAFGPLSLAATTGGTMFITSWRVSGPTNIRGGVEKAAHPSGKPAKIKWRKPHSVAPFLIMPQDVMKAKPGIFNFRASVTASDAIDVKLSMGADSPFKVWLNGGEVARDLTATNPAIADQYQFPVALKKSRNEIVVAFDGRSGQGWGICARFFPMREGDAIPEGAISV